MSFVTHIVVTHASASKGTGLGVSLQKMGRGKSIARLVVSLRPDLAAQFGWADKDRIEVALGQEEHHGMLRLRKSETGSAELSYRVAGGSGHGGPYFNLSLGHVDLYVDRAEPKRWALFEVLEDGWIEIVLPAWADETSPLKVSRARPSAGLAPVIPARPAMSAPALTARMMGDPPAGRSALAQKRVEGATELGKGEARRRAEEREAAEHAAAEAAEWNRRAQQDNVLADLMQAFALTGSEARLVRELLDGRMKTRLALHTAAYGDDPQGGPEIKIIDVFISKLRKKLKVKAVEIATVHGQGYRMEAHTIARVLKIIGQAPDQPSREDDEAELAQLGEESDIGETA
jgi:hypothetical protein